MAYLRKLSNFLLGNYFLMYLIAQLFVLSRGWDPPLPQVVYSVNALYGIFILTKINKFKTMDFIVLFYLGYIILNGLSSDYPNKGFLLYKAFVIQITCIFTYFVGRSNGFNIIVLDKNRLLILITCVLGLYFFFAMPGWYAGMKANMINNDVDVMAIGESMRLSAFWAHPYYLVYATMSIVPFVLLGLTEGNKNNKLLFLEIFLIALTLLLAQLRVAIVCFLLFLFYFLFKRSIDKTKFIIISFISVFFIGLILSYIILNYLGKDALAYLLEHSSSVDVDSRFNATSGGYRLDTLFGAGFGRYSTKTATTFAIIDNEYQRILAEVGIFGFLIIMIIFLSSIVRMIKLKGRHAEKMIIIFYIIACFAASVLTNPTQYPFIFWIALGSLWSDNKIQLKFKHE